VDTPFTMRCRAGQVLRIPIAHGEGNFYAPPDTVAQLETAGQVVFRYADAGGAVNEAANPNGSINNIAGLCNATRNVVGLMPHPERACEPIVGSADGRILFESVIEQLATRGRLQAVTS
jgi:phosphoribosylformylglycinamidine synthase